MSEQRATRRTGTALLTAIRQATVDEWLEHGYAGTTFEGVARRAGTSKPVLYRRYRSRAHMVLDSWSFQNPLELPARGSGSLRGDLIAILGAINERFTQVGSDTFRGVLAEVDDELFEELPLFAAAAATDTLSRVLHEARLRGELGDESIPQRVQLLPLTLLRHEFFFSREPPTERVLTEIVDQVCVPILKSAASQTV